MAAKKNRKSQDIMGPYLKKIRKKIGHQKIIYPGARIIIENEIGEILFVLRNDNGKPGLPAGGMEENETLSECIIREVWEETGLELFSFTLIGISSDPVREYVRYPNDDEIQYITMEFYCHEWRGTLKINDMKEIQAAKFLPPHHVSKLPENEYSTWTSLEYFKRTGGVRLH